MTCSMTHSGIHFCIHPVFSKFSYLDFSDSIRGKVGTPAGRTIYPPLPAISPFLSSDDNTADSDTPDTPPSPTYAFAHGNRYRYILSWPVTQYDCKEEGGPFTHSSSCCETLSDHSSSDSSSNFHSHASSDSSSRHSFQVIFHLIIPSLLLQPSRKDGGVKDFWLSGRMDRGIDARVIVEAVDRDETETGREQLEAIEKFRDSRDKDIGFESCSFCFDLRGIAEFRRGINMSLEAPNLASPRNLIECYVGIGVRKMPNTRSGASKSSLGGRKNWLPAE
ncbi:hypothetical protein Tco_0011316 [Tanacetum coccineum]